MPIFRCSVHDTDTGQMHDIEVTFEPGSPTESLLQALPVPVGGRSVFVGPHQLDPNGTVGESLVIPGCVLSIGAPAPDPREEASSAIGVLRVLEGQDAGRWTWVRPGAPSLLGRSSPELDLPLNDPLVSRRHALVSTAGPGERGVQVSDLASANGTTVNGVRVDGTVLAGPGDVLAVGDSRVEVTILENVTDRWTRADDGRLEFNPRFHNAPRPEPITVEMPPRPPEAGGGLLAMTGSFGAPLALGVVMAAAQSSADYLLMGVVSPLTGGIQQLVERRRRRAHQAEFDEKKQFALARIAAAARDQERLRRLNDPDELHLALCAEGALPRLWTKRLASADALQVRVGIRDDPLEIDLRGEPWPGFEIPQLKAVPTTVDLRDIGVLGVVGDPATVEGLARWMLIQLATRRSPEDLQLAVFCGSDSDHLRWSRWLPHLDTGDDGVTPCRVAGHPDAWKREAGELRTLIKQREAARGLAGRPALGSDVVVVLDGAHALRAIDDMPAVLRQGPDVGVYTICLDETDINECKGRITADADGRLEIVRTFTGGSEYTSAETTSPESAERIARLLAPLRDRAQVAARGGAIPERVRYLDLVGLHHPGPDDVIQVWSRHPGPTMRVPLGRDARDVVHVDLIEQGPHTMLGGATGAGKSILLQTLVASLLLHNRPDELNLVLVDFKGGAAFTPFENCPQVVGKIYSTDEDEASTFDAAAGDRAVASVQAEVTRREKLLRPYGGEIDNYLAQRRPDDPPLPRLLIVIDEFARIADKAPTFIKNLIGVAGKGRSLGMHLLLATQSLQGQVGPEMRNNISLRISLRQNDADQSTDVLGVPDAAGIPKRLRGRGLILTVGDEVATPRPVQTAYLGDPPSATGAPPATVRLLDWTVVGEPRPKDDTSRHGGPTDQSNLVAAIEIAGRRISYPTPFRPLLPALPGRLSLGEMAALASGPAPAGAIPFGLADEPTNQAQPMAYLDLDGTDQLMIAGGARSGRTTTVRTLVHSAVARFASTDLHVYVVERQPSGLAAFEDLPHCGGVFGPAEKDRVRRFVTWLNDELNRRLAARFGTGPHPPRLLVLIDGWEHFHDPSDAASVETSLVTMLRNAIKDGPTVRVHVAVTCDRGPFRSKPSELFGSQLVLRFPQADIVKNALPNGSVVPPQVPGRAGEVSTGRHVQIAAPDESDNALVERFRGTARPADRGPRRFPSLPEHVDSVPRPDDATADWIPLGIGGPDLGPVGIDLFDAPQSFLISGPPGSGRSNAAAVVVQGLNRLGVGCLVLCMPRSPLPRLVTGLVRVQVLVGPSLSDEVVRQAATGLGTSKTVIVVDDCEQLTVIPTTKSFDELPTLLMEATTPERLGAMGLVLCGDAMPLLGGPSRSLSRVARSLLDSASRLHLTPTLMNNVRELGIKLEIDELFAGPAGRGVLVGNSGPVQLLTARTGGGSKSIR